MDGYTHGKGLEIELKTESPSTSSSLRPAGGSANPGTPPSPTAQLYRTSLATRTGPAPAPAAQPSEEGLGTRKTQQEYARSPSRLWSPGSRQLQFPGTARFESFHIVEARRLRGSREAPCEFQVLTLSAPTWCLGSLLS